MLNFIRRYPEKVNAYRRAVRQQEEQRLDSYGNDEKLSAQPADALLCSDQQFGQDAVEWAIVSGFIRLTYDLQQDLRLIMGEPGKPETGAYPMVVEVYRRVLRQREEQLLDSNQL